MTIHVSGMLLLLAAKCCHNNFHCKIHSLKINSELDICHLDLLYKDTILKYQNSFCFTFESKPYVQFCYFKVMQTLIFIILNCRKRWEVRLLIFSGCFNTQYQWKIDLQSRNTEMRTKE